MWKSISEGLPHEGWNHGVGERQSTQVKEMRFAKSQILVYSTGFCPYCIRARRLLNRKRVRFLEIRVDRDPEQWVEMERRSGRNTVPQIFVGETHVGGYDDMATLDRQGELDGILNIVRV